MVLDILYIYLVDTVVFLKNPAPLYILGWGPSLKLLVEMCNRERLWNLCEFCSVVQRHSSPSLWSWHSKHTSSYARIDFLPWMGWGVWASTLVNNQLWRGCETHYWSRAEKSVTVVLYNYWWSQKMPPAKHNLLFVMLDRLSLVCVKPLCSTLMFPHHVYLYYVQLAFIFLWWFQPGKWTPVLFRSCKRNKFFPDTPLGPGWTWKSGHRIGYQGRQKS